MNRILPTLFLTISLGVALPSMAADMNGSMNMGGNMDATKQSEKISHGVGVIKKIDTEQGKITFSHQPIIELNWPAMTMAFKVADPKLLQGLTVGQKVAFELKGDGMSPVVILVRPAK